MPPTTTYPLGSDTGAPSSLPPQAMGQPRLGPIMRPTPLPKRPKGRWFVGILLIAIVGFAGYLVWDVFFRYQAYGVVEGRIVQVPATLEGVVQYVFVREGDKVGQGQLLMSLDIPELRDRYALLSHQLRVAESDLHSELARLHWHAAYRTETSQQAVAQYYETWGEMLKAKATLEGLRIELDRLKTLYNVRAVTAQDLNLMNASVRGQEELVKKLKTALEERKKRAEQTQSIISKDKDLKAGLEEGVGDQLRPTFSKIEALQEEMELIRKRLAQNQLRAPTNGIIISRAHHPGEYCRPGDAMFSILEEGTLQVVLYMPQKSSTQLKKGEEVRVLVDPDSHPANCEVVRVGDRYEPAPANLERHYMSKEKLLPVYLKPNGASAGRMTLLVGSVVKLPRLDLQKPEDLGRIFARREKP